MGFLEGAVAWYGICIKHQKVSTWMRGVIPAGLEVGHAPTFWPILEGYGTS